MMSVYLRTKILAQFGYSSCDTVTTLMDHKAKFQTRYKTDLCAPDQVTRYQEMIGLSMQTRPNIAYALRIKSER